MNLDKPRNDLLRSAKEADAPPRHRVRLREAADQNGPLAHPRVGGDGAVRRPLVDESVIDLVADYHQVACHGDLGERLARWLVEGGPGWIRWVAKEEGLRAGGCGVYGIGVQAPVITSARRHWNDGAARKDDSGEVGNVRRLWQHNVIARTDDPANGEVDRLRGTDRDDDLALWVVAHA